MATRKLPSYGLDDGMGRSPRRDPGSPRLPEPIKPPLGTPPDNPDPGPFTGPWQQGGTPESPREIAGPAATPVVNAPRPPGGATPAPSGGVSGQPPVPFTPMTQHPDVMRRLTVPLVPPPQPGRPPSLYSNSSGLFGKAGGLLGGGFGVPGAVSGGAGQPTDLLMQIMQLLRGR